MKGRIRLGDLLIGANLVTAEQVEKALDYQGQFGGKLGELLVETGALSQEKLEAFLYRMPTEPQSIAATGIHDSDLLTLLIKLIYAGRLETVRQFVEAIKLPYHIVLELIPMAIDRQLLRALGMRDTDNLVDMSYALTEEGRRRAQDALQQSRYSGPAPVTLGEFTEMVSRQKLTNETVTYPRIRKALGDLVFDSSMIEKAGPALNAGRSMLLYGPPGNGKTSVALSFSTVFDDVIYMPYAVMIEGQIMRVFDASVHTVLEPPVAREDNTFSFVRQEEYDTRWVPCKRPFVIAGGELTLEMLDLRYDAVANFYEAPLHVKALGGCFIIDDFGRQLVSPSNLLNRWIVPLESRVDYLKLHTGKSFTIPFEELIIFSTNIDPEDLMDPAFLRRLPYKIEVGAPTLDLYRQIFDKECECGGLVLSDEMFELIVLKITEEKGLELAAFQPKFITDQVLATCRFMDQLPHFEPRFIDYAIDNLRVHRPGAKGPAAVESRSFDGALSYMAS
ncbi:ATP-binding protein [Alloacidobacterium dinghuense]|uniref:ATP-binding protein n=1 Tax=Alloacidobacterium dinghuense TaxID=2763107 RepID=A0A7G8BJ66_9BACT|nr:ATP-binding protein [Alloacidobacterium dinghuense]QNI32586.1 ATP-binding protein [Alloacidobacterium dinghuense]